MKAFDYGRTRATADRLIARFGRPATAIRATATGPAYNPDLGAPVEHPVQVVVTEYDDRDIDGSRVLRTDRKGLISAGGLSIQLATSDKLRVGGETLNIVALKPLSPAGTVVLYQAQLRK